ncbi:MAG: hypothetical protein PXX77_07615 [Gallionella sp.]|nr:hypothetical protein [Gallionella sp.]
MQLLLKRPAYLLSLLWLACFGVCVATAWFAAKQPSINVPFVARAQQIHVGDTVDEATTGVQSKAKVLWLQAAGMERIELKPTDLIEEPDFFDTYAEMEAFFARQSTLFTLLRASEVHIVWQDEAGQQHDSMVRPEPRTLSGLPFVFWFQLFVITSMFMISTAVFAVRPDDWGARMFALTGVFAVVALIPLAVYSTRSLALDGDLFSMFSTSNHVGAAMYACALIAMFLLYPRQIITPRRLWVLPAIYGVILLGDFLHVLPDQHWGAHYSPFSQIVLLAICAAWQWRQTRGYPLERNVLRWVGLSVLMMCGLLLVAFTLLIQTGSLFIGEGYLTGAFLIMYFGIALGLRKYRLFDMDEWAYRVFLWVGSAVAVIVLDVVLMMGLGLGQVASTSTSLLVVGWLYFPFRQWLWQRIVSKQTPGFERLLPELSAIAFTASLQEQQTRWQALLQRIFDPLEIRPIEEGGSGLRDNGLGMVVPGCSNLSAYSLRYAGRGMRLFSTRDAAFAVSLSQLLEQIMSGRNSYEQGVAQERLRIGRDLHDNIGARLLKLIHHLRGTPDAEIARDAMKDLRTSIAAMDSQPIPLRDALADWRAEASSRCEVVQCQLHWRQSDALPELELHPRMKGMLESVMREVITNALKHASPSNLNVGVESSQTALKVEVANDGNVTDPLTWQDGYGLRNIRGRMDELGGNLSIASDAEGVRLTISVPLP